MTLIRPLIAALFCLLAVSSANARKPAVEDFVGVEPENYTETAQGTELAYRFGNLTNAYQPAETGGFGEWTPLAVLAFFLALPFGMWYGITRSSAGRKEEPSTNVAKLSDYRGDEKEKSEDFKQAG